MLSRERASARTSFPGQSLLSLKDLSYSYDQETLALKKVNLEIKRGESLFVTGASGAGKTTLLKILAGEINPNKGQIFRNKGGDGLPLFCAQVFQDLRLIENFTLKENLLMAFDSRLYKSRKNFNSDMMELSKILGLHTYLERKICDCNGGLKQKTAIVRALLSRPDVLLADEPTSSLDYDNARRIFELLRAYVMKRGLTVIWASHNRELVKKFEGRIAHLENGNLIYSGNACFI